MEAKLKRMMVVLKKYESQERRNAIYGTARRAVQNRIVLLLKGQDMEELRRLRYECR